MLDHLSPFWVNPICVVDFESTSADPNECLPVQVGAVLFAGSDTREFCTMIDPGVAIPVEASAIHGIKDEDVRGMPSPEDALRMLEAWLGDDEAVPCAYNASFDATIYKRFSGGSSNGHFLNNRPWVDPLIMIRHFDRWVPGKGRHRLANAFKRWGVDLDGGHDALHDARATGRLLLAMKPKLGDVTYSELIRRQSKRAEEQERDFSGWRSKQPPIEKKEGNEGAADLLRKHGVLS
jgi:DNA polymerase-3 subunit epsilon